MTNPKHTFACVQKDKKIKSLVFLKVLLTITAARVLTFTIK